MEKYLLHVREHAAFLEKMYTLKYKERRMRRRGLYAEPQGTG
jgi:hypothetical protein